MTYEDFYRIAEYGSQAWRGKLTAKEMACYAYDYMCEYEESKQAGTPTNTMIELCRLLVTDLDYEGIGVVITGDLDSIDTMEKVLNKFVYEYLSFMYWTKSAANKFKVKIPNGYLMVEEKGVENEYPGVWIGFSADGKEFGEAVACVEYDSCAEEIRTETYQRGYEEAPNNIICFEDGRNVI